MHEQMQYTTPKYSSSNRAGAKEVYRALKTVGGAHQTSPTNWTLGVKCAWASRMDV